MTSLEEANRRLLEMQAARRQQRIEQGLLRDDQTLIDQGFDRDHGHTAVVPAIVQSLPDHLGWGSDALTRALRQAQLRRQSPPAASYNTRVFSDTDSSQQPTGWAKSAPAEASAPAQVILYPDLAAAILRRNLDAPARVWLLLRAHDTNGRGWLSLVNARQLLTTKASPWKVISRRQLHNLLSAGEGVFWTQNDGAVWLRSPAKVAAGLGVSHLRGRAVTVAPSTLLGHVADVRAQLYAAYLAGRPHADMPIARETIAAVTGVAERTQKDYELRTKISATANFCIGERLASDNMQAQAWAHRGQGAFALTDKKGLQGPPGHVYLAWQIPNTYETQHQPCPRGKQRRVNRELKGLLNKTAAGNSSSPENHQRRYYPNGGKAAKAYNRSRDPVYWRRSGSSRSKVWHELG